MIFEGNTIVELKVVVIISVTYRFCIPLFAKNMHTKTTKCTYILDNPLNWLKHNNMPIQHYGD